MGVKCEALAVIIGIQAGEGRERGRSKERRERERRGSERLIRAVRHCFNATNSLETTHCAPFVARARLTSRSARFHRVFPVYAGVRDALGTNEGECIIIVSFGDAGPQRRVSLISILFQGHFSCGDRCRMMVDHCRYNAWTHSLGGAS